MTSVTMIYEDAPASIPVPDDMRNRRVEAVFRALDETVDEDSGKKPGSTTHREITPTNKASLPSLAEFRGRLPRQRISAGEFCRAMRDQDRY
ncbi:MAG: hypothetical protein VBE63_12495 [Lamprobacter sp.]|uniref:hypothetical protein n=1 Tax=Lamprobacter sp. TaxID=3100796 RepID=UPI002B26467A|nr:hypothetical protein [Lamprobacter sp.]MEA3640747.1 hypothetical protein [Lamprobacter sp.]